MLQTACSMSEFNCSLVRLIFVAEKRLFTLVLIASLQVCIPYLTHQIVLIASLQSPLVLCDLRAFLRTCYNRLGLAYGLKPGWNSTI